MRNVNEAAGVKHVVPALEASHEELLTVRDAAGRPLGKDRQPCPVKSDRWRRSRTRDGAGHGRVPVLLLARAPRPDVPDAQRIVRKAPQQDE